MKNQATKTLLKSQVEILPNQRSIDIGSVAFQELVLVLHFGSFHLLSCGWRFAGVQARPLMDRPLASASVSEFWGRRWNTAFRDLTHLSNSHPF